MTQEWADETVVSSREFVLEWNVSSGSLGPQYSGGEGPGMRGHGLRNHSPTSKLRFWQFWYANYLQLVLTNGDETNKYARTKLKVNTMDAMDILGSLLGGGKSQGGGGSLGGKILKDLINSGSRSSAQPSAPQAPSRQAPSSQAPSRRPVSLEDRARELEDLLNVAHGREESRAQRQPAPAPIPPAQPRYQPAPPPARPRYQEPQPTPRNTSFPPATGAGTSHHSSTDSFTQNDEALVLVRAMINAAKADGSISQQEQQAIIERIANPTQETIDFLRQEFSSPVNVRDFAWSVPLGMEQQVYTLSLASIELDTNPEASYLRDLAHGLRLDPEFCNDLHRRYNAPTIF